MEEAARKKEIAFRENPFDAVLRTHKLHGKEKDAYAFWIDYSRRIKFIFLDEETVLFLDIGATTYTPEVFQCPVGESAAS